MDENEVQPTEEEATGTKVTLTPEEVSSIKQDTGASYLGATDTGYVPEALGKVVGVIGNAWNAIKLATTPGRSIAEFKWKDLSPPEPVAAEKLEVSADDKVKFDDLVRAKLRQGVKDEVLANKIAEVAGVPEEAERLKTIARNKMHFTDEDTPAEVVGKTVLQTGDHLFANLPTYLWNKMSGAYDNLPRPPDMKFADGKRAWINKIRQEGESRAIDFNGMEVTIDPWDTDEQIDNKVWEKLEDRLTDTYIDATRMGVFDDIAALGMATRALGKAVSPLTVSTEAMLKTEKMIELAKQSTALGRVTKFAMAHPRALAAVTQATEAIALQEHPQDEATLERYALPMLMSGVGGLIHGMDLTPRKVEKARAIAEEVYKTEDDRGVRYMSTDPSVIPNTKHPDIPVELVQKELQKLHISERIKNKFSTVDPRMLQETMDNAVYDPEIRVAIDVWAKEIADGTPESIRNTMAVRRVMGDQRSKLKRDLALETAPEKVSELKIQKARLDGIERDLSQHIFDTDRLLAHVEENYPHMATPMKEWIGVHDLDVARRELLTDMLRNVLNSEKDPVAIQLKQRANVGILEGLDSLIASSTNTRSGYYRRQAAVNKLQQKIDSNYRQVSKVIGRVLDEVTAVGDPKLIDEVKSLSDEFHSNYSNKTNLNMVGIGRRLTELKNSEWTSPQLRSNVDTIRASLDSWFSSQKKIDNHMVAIGQYIVDSKIVQSDYSLQSRINSKDADYRPTVIVNEIMSSTDPGERIVAHHHTILSHKNMLSENTEAFQDLTDKIVMRMRKGLEIPPEVITAYETLMDSVTGASLKAEYRKSKDLYTKALNDENPALAARYKKEMEIFKKSYEGTVPVHPRTVTYFTKALKQYNKEQKVMKTLYTAVHDVLQVEDPVVRNQQALALIGMSSQAMHQLQVKRFRTAAQQNFKKLAPMWEEITADFPFSPERRLEMFEEFTGSFLGNMERLKDPQFYQATTNTHVLNIKAALSAIPARVLDRLDGMHRETFGKPLDKELFLGYFLTPNNNFDAWKLMENGYFNLAGIQRGAEAKKLQGASKVMYTLWSADYGEHEMSRITGLATVEGVEAFSTAVRQSEAKLHDLTQNLIPDRKKRNIISWAADKVSALKHIDGQQGFTRFYDRHSGQQGGHSLDVWGQVHKWMFIENNEVTRGMYATHGEDRFVAAWSEKIRELDKKYIASLTEKERAEYHAELEADARREFTYNSDFAEKDAAFWKDVWTERQWIKDVEAAVFREHVNIVAEMNRKYADLGVRIQPKQWREQRVLNEIDKFVDIEDLGDVFRSGEDYTRLFGTSFQGQIEKARMLTGDLKHPVKALSDSNRRLIIGAYTAHARAYLDNYRVLVEGMGQQSVGRYLKLFMAGGKSVQEVGDKLNRTLAPADAWILKLYNSLGENRSWPLVLAIALRPVTKLAFGAGVWVTKLANPANLIANTIGSVNFLLTQSGSGAFPRVPWYVKYPTRLAFGAAGASVMGPAGFLVGASADMIARGMWTAVKMGVSGVAQIAGVRNPSFGSHLSPVINEVLNGYRDLKHRESISMFHLLLQLDSQTKKSGIKTAITANQWVDKAQDVIIDRLKEPSELAVSHVCLSAGADVYQAAYEVMKKRGVAGKQIAYELIQDSSRSRNQNEIWSQVNNIYKAVTEDKPVQAARDFLQFYHSSVIGKYGSMAAPVIIKNIASTLPGITRFFAAKTMGMYRVSANVQDAYRLTIDPFLRAIAGTKIDQMPKQAQGMVWASAFSLFGLAGAAYLLNNGLGQSTVDKLKSDTDDDAKTNWLRRMYAGREKELMRLAVGYGKGLGVNFERYVPLSREAVTSWTDLIGGSGSYSTRGAGYMFGPGMANVVAAIKDYTNAAEAFLWPWIDKAVPFYESKIEEINSKIRHEESLGNIDEVDKLNTEKIKIVQDFEGLKWRTLGDAIANNSAFTAWIANDISPFKMAMIVRGMMDDMGLAAAKDMSEERRAQFGAARAELQQAPNEELYYPFSNLYTFMGWNEFFDPNGNFLYDLWYQKIGPYFGLNEEEIAAFGKKALELDQKIREADEISNALVHAGWLNQKSAIARSQAAKEVSRIGMPQIKSEQIDLENLYKVLPAETVQRLMGQKPAGP